MPVKMPCGDRQALRLPGRVYELRLDSAKSRNLAGGCVRERNSIYRGLWQLGAFQVMSHHKMMYKKARQASGLPCSDRIDTGMFY